MVSTPAFVMDTEKHIEASIEGSYITERIGKGTTFVKWYAKKVDYQNPWYNDTVVYRKVSQREGNFTRFILLKLLSHFSRSMNILPKYLIFILTICITKNGQETDPEM